MSRRLSRLSLALVLLLSSEVWAVGLGDIRLDSALNEPLRAEIELLSATADELASLEISLASADTFSRYGIDRPVYLQQIRFDVISSGADGAFVRLTSPVNMTEPFLTFLVEASWPGGRLLREYTVFLDPPTYVPPPAQTAPAVTAPSVSAPADTGRIERPAAVETPAPQPPPRTPAPSASSQPPAQADTTPYGTQSGGDYVVQRSETLWGIASRMRPDARLTMNQTMVAIYQANPDAFGGNINLLKAGATLRIPSADEVFQISRGDAFSEVQRQNSNWQSGVTDYTPPPAETRPSLTLVPPDEEPATGIYDEQAAPDEALTREQEIENRIAELESADVPQQQSLIEIRDTELANLRQELANIRGEVYEPPVADDPFVDATEDEAPVDGVEAPADAAADDEIPADDADQVAADAADAAAAADETAETAPPVVRTTRVSQPSLLERITELLTGFWGAIIGAAILIGGLLFWLVRRQGGEVSDTGPWQPLDSDDRAHDDTMTATKTIPAPTRDDDEAIVVVEDTAARPLEDATAEMPTLEAEVDVDEPGDFASIEDTFSSDTAINLDQTDPVAEADFHMAYGLYDQAADLINGALETDPKDAPLLAKLCEVYFVWGNRDEFVDAAKRLQAAVGDATSADWDKTVIMGQQIAADDPMFEDAGLTAATQAIDMAFDPAEGGEGALDMDFGSDDVDFAGTDIVDLGEVADADAENDAGTGVDSDTDFLFGDDVVADDDSADEVATDDLDTIADELDLTEEATAEMPALESTSEMETVEIRTPDSTDTTVESPTVESPLGAADATSELPSIEEESAGDAIEPAETAEINLDDLDLDIDQFAETELASLDDDLDDFEDLGDVEAAGTEEAIDEDADEAVDLEALIKPDDTGEMPLAKDDTGVIPPMKDEHEETDVDIDDSLLEATGITQILDDDLTVEAPGSGQVVLGEDEATIQLPSEGGEFDFAQTEALSPDADAVQAALEKTGEMPALAETDVDLDLDDLTAALKVNEMGDAADDVFDEDTAEQPSPAVSDTAEIPTLSLAPDEMSDDLNEARTMTEVGTKLDLARAYVDMGDPAGARSILEEVLDEGDESQRQQAQQLLDSLPG
jgi:pilus assembly protein FimV